MGANVRLQRLAEPFLHLGLLYGSALANLLRDDGKVSGALPNRNLALAYGADVVRFAVEQMLNLRWIVCLGWEAWEVASRAVGVVGRWEAHRDGAQPLGPLIAAFHPSARISRERMVRPWGALRERAA